MSKIRELPNAKPNGKLTLEFRREKVQEEIARLEAFLLKLRGALDMLNTLIEDRDKEPPPEAA